MKKLIILFTFCFLNNFAQNKTFEGETIFLHTNASTFITGETLRYKIYCRNAATKEASKISKIAYVEIINEKGESITRNKIILKEGVASNEMFISTQFTTGTYKLVAYTNWMLNNTVNTYFETELTVINPFLPYKNSRKETTSETIVSSTTDAQPMPLQSSAITLKSNKSKYSKREAVSIALSDDTGQFTDGNYSLSVRKIDGLSQKNSPSSAEFMQKTSEPLLATDAPKYLPELRGEIVSGKITTRDENKSIKDVHVGASIVGEPFDLKIVKTNSDGAFHFILDETINTPKLQLQLIENSITDYQLTINPPAKIATPTNFSKVKITEKDIATIEERLVASQIVNAYAVKDSISGNSTTVPFYHYNAKEYVLDNYKRFPSFKETIIEIIPAVYFKENNGDFSLHIRDYQTGGDSFGSALVIIDGLLLQDVTELFDYNTKNIYKIDVINKAYAYGSKIFSGVISITTFSRAYASKSNTIVPVQFERCKDDSAFVPKRYDTQTDYSRIPDYRYQLAWEPSIKLNKTNTTQTFFTSDVEGLFEISLEGFSKNGTPVSIKNYFEVK